MVKYDFQQQITLPVFSQHNLCEWGFELDNLQT